MFRALDVSGDSSVGQALDSSTSVENELQALDQYTPSTRSNPAGTSTSTNDLVHRGRAGESTIATGTIAASGATIGSALSRLCIDDY